MEFWKGVCQSRMLPEQSIASRVLTRGNEVIIKL